jgi:CRISPR-associated endonuclease/helicase Cas3
MSTNGKKTTTDLVIQHIKAKGDGEPLGTHTIKDLQTSYRLLENLPFVDARLSEYLQLACACHDIGKACTGFQKSLHIDGVVQTKWGKRHEIVSAVFAAQLGLPPEVIFSVITHHKDLSGEVKACLQYEDVPLSTTDILPSWIELVQEFNTNIIPLRNDWGQICDFISRPDLVNISPLTESSSLSNYRDWLIRSKQLKIPFKDRYFASLLRGLLISSDHIASSDVEMPIRIPDLKTFDLISSSSFLQRLHGYQEVAMNTTGSVVLRAPTGSGKTLAALLWAQNNQKINGRLFYCLPTQTSINAMYLRLKEYFPGKGIVGLLHSRVASTLYNLYEEDSSNN